MFTGQCMTLLRPNLNLQCYKISHVIIVELLLPVILLSHSVRPLKPSKYDAKTRVHEHLAIKLDLIELTHCNHFRLTHNVNKRLTATLSFSCPFNAVLVNMNGKQKMRISSVVFNV